MRYGLLAINVILLATVAAFVLHNHDSSASLQQNAFGALSDHENTGPVDEISAADIAVHVARLTAMDESVSVANLADTLNYQNSIVPADDTVVAKPQIIANASKSKRDIVVYTTVQGDSVSALAQRFGVSSDSIRWSNGVSGEALPTGKQLLIPPMEGIVYVVKEGDTIDSLVARYRANRERFVAVNDAELGLKIGDRIVIPGGTQPVARVSTFTGGLAWGTAAVYGSNGYDYGYCTWYVANRRIALGRPLPANLGNAWTWDNIAIRIGLPVDNNPEVGAAIVTGTGSYPGHVAIVERINEDGSIWLSEMNSHGQVSIDNPAPYGGWNRVDFKFIPAGAVHSYNYIH